MEAIMREQILNGKLELPSKEQFYDNFTRANIIERMFISMWHAYLHSKSAVSLAYWSKEFEHPVEFNQALKVLSDSNWIISHSIPARNWAEAELNEDKLLQFVSVEELADVRAKFKFAKYLPCFMESKHATLTRMNGKVKRTGLTRYGLKASASSPFQYDVDYLSKYEDTIIQNTNKGMQKVRNQFPDMRSDSASYDAIATSIVEHLTINPETYTMGSNYSDPRGRSVKEGLSKVFNPIGYKDARSLLVIPEAYRNLATDKGATAIYLFIAELLGFKGGTPVDKELYGVECYKARKLHTLDLSNESDRSELHENMWLSRLYDELDCFYTSETTGIPHYWSTPVELDASASMLSHKGLLLGSKRMLEATNTSFTGTFNDPWKVDGVSRLAVKTSIMPMLYASSKAPHELLTDNKVPYTLEDIHTLNEELNSGMYSEANNFKEFLLRWVKPSPEMQIHVYEDQFTVECNRFRNVGETTLQYDIFDTESNSVRRITHTDTKRVPDLEQFRRWFVTGLIHSQDSQVLDFTMEKVIDQYSWGIDIHDAIIVCPEAVDFTREAYAEELQVIYDNRKEILSNYFTSVGIGAEAMSDWSKLMESIPQVETFKASKWALK